MRSLLIDTSSFFMTISILEDDEVLYSFSEEIKSDMASKIIPVIEKAFNEVNFSIQDVSKIYVVNGPGSFTGVRVGVTVAKIMAWSLKKEIVILSSLELLATTPVETKYKVSAIDARRGYVYAGVYDNDLNIILADQYISFNELEDYLKDGTLISHDESLNGMKPNIDISMIIRKHQNDKGLNPHEVKPNYLKMTEAEEKRLAGVA